jgi:serine/threonine-protein kinase
MTALRSALDLLEPGALLGGALFESLAQGAALVGRLPVGTRLGPFRIVDEIGAGGMGVVYRAERDDGQYRQQVAIKCVAASDDADQLALFRRERQILAEIRHPHIARLLDGGQLDDGQLWFAMELVEGARIDEHVRRHQPSVAARLNLLREAIGAVGFAHQRLLLHRDIKPGNVLIDADGSVKLLDFGIASLIGDREAARAYSPAWASPEQLAGGELGPASDQYQLGLLLDRLLRRDELAPHEIDATAERGIRPDLWLALPRRRGGELRSIVERATAADPLQRYGSVSELDADLLRWLQQRPVLAHGSGVGYALASAIRRHPWIALASLATTLAILAMIGGFSWRLAAERDLAQAAAERATREAQTSTAIARFLQYDLLALADPNTSQDVDLKVVSLLERATASVDARLADRPEIAAQIHMTLGRSLRGLGDLVAAGAQFERAQRLLRELPVADPRRLELDLWHGDLELAASQAAAAHARLDRVQQLAVAASGNDSQLALEAAVRAQAARFEMGEEEPAIAALTALLPRLDAALGADSALSIYALNRLAIMYNSIERSADSERVRLEHLQRATRAYGPEHSTTLTGRLNRAVLLRKLGRTEEALTEALAAEQGLRKVFGFPSIAALHAMNARSRILMDSQRLDEAIALQRETLAGRIALLGPDHDDVAYSHVNLGGMLVAARDYAGAIAEFERALAIRTQTLEPDHVDLITNLTLLADTHRLDGQLERAAGYAEDAVTRARRALSPDRPELASALFRQAQILLARGDRQQARTNADEALQVYRRAYPDEHPRVLSVKRFLDDLGPAAPPP